MKTVCIIPARFASSRLPGKPLAMIAGKSVIERVYRQAQQAVDRVVVATDDSRIFDAVAAFGGEAVMTSVECPNGTARCLEACIKLGIEPDSVVVNLQGDEPFVAPGDIRALAVDCQHLSEVPTNGAYGISTLIYKASTDDLQLIMSPNNVKAVISDNNEALYFSRSPIPYCRDAEISEWTSQTDYYLHQGIYAYTMNALSVLANLPQSRLSLAENLEQLTWLQAGFRISCVKTGSRSIGIDTPADLIEAENRVTEGLRR